MAVALALFLLAAVMVFSVRIYTADAEDTVSTVKAENSYILRVSTNASAGGDIASFIVRYLDEKGEQHSEVILPNDGDYTKSCTRAYATGKAENADGSEESDRMDSTALRNLIAKTYPYQVEGWQLEGDNLVPDFENLKSLQVNSTNEYIFTTSCPVKVDDGQYQFVAVDVIHCGTTAPSAWTCSGMQIIKLKGKTDSDTNADLSVTMNGIYSNDTSMVYTGQLAAELQAGTTDSKAGTTTFNASFGRSADSSKMYRIDTSGGTSQNSVSLKLVNAIDEDAKDVAMSSEPYTVKIDLADVTGAGETAFMSGTTPKTLNDFAETDPLEHMSVGITYTDKQGVSRTVTVPATILEAAAQLTAENKLKAENPSGDSRENDLVMGAFLQGESYAFPVELINIDDNIRPSITLYYGEEYAKTSADLTYTGTETLEDGTNSIQVAGIQIYEGNLVSYTNQGTHTLSGLLANATTSEKIFTSQSVTCKDYNSRLTETGACKWFYTASTTSGITLYAGHKLTKELHPYKDTNTASDLKPTIASSGNRYLVEIQTDVLNQTTDSSTDDSTEATSENADSTKPTADETINQTTSVDVSGMTGTEDTLYITIVYQDVYGTTHQLDEINIRDAVNTYYGIWPIQKYKSTGIYDGESEPDGAPSNEGGYILGASEGGTLRFTFDAVNLGKVVSCTIRKDGTDDYQLKSIEVKKVAANGYGSLAYYRVQDFKDKGGEVIECGNWKTSWKVDREITLDSSGGEVSVYGEYTPEEGIHGLLIQDEEKTISLTGTSQTTKNSDSLDWSKYYDQMSITDVKQHFGYATVRGDYAVTVKVAGDDAKTDTDSGNVYDDSGSVNLFYFQLMFENGKTSGYVLANQQLEADGFRTGMSETFHIYTNYDYGKVEAVRIIPDDITGDSDNFDKLQIETISVQKARSAAIDEVWNCDDVGWIGISYNDTGAKESTLGQESRTEAEMAHIYRITSITQSVRLLFYMRGSAMHSTEQLDDGTMWMQISYLDQENKTQTLNVDVYKAMYTYMNQTPKLKGGDGSDSGVAVIDPDTMLKGNQGNFFEVTLNNPKQIKSLTFDVTENGSGKWCLSDVRVFRILSGTGNLFIANNGTYMREYTLSSRAIAVSTDDLYTCPLFSKTNSFDVDMDSDEIVLDSTGVVSTITKDSQRRTALQDTILNVYAYADTAKVNGDYTATLTAIYSNGTETQTISNEVMPLSLSDGESTFAVKAISVPNLTQIDQLKLTIKNGTDYAAENPITKVVVEQVSLGTVRETYEYTVNSGDDTFSNGVLTLGEDNLKAVSDSVTARQMMYIAVSKNCSGGTVGISDADVNNDLAVAIQYRSGTGSGQTANSSYYFYSDYLREQQENGKTPNAEIVPGEVIVIPLKFGDIKDIESVRLIAKGGMDIAVEAVSIGLYSDSKDNCATEWFSFEPDDDVTLSETPQRIAVTGARVTPTGEELNVAESEMTSSDDVLVPVNISLTKTASSNVDDLSMVLQYTDSGNYSVTVNSMAKYITDGSLGMKTGGQADTVTFTVMLHNIISASRIQSVLLEPVCNDSESQNKASITISNISITVGDGGTQASKDVGAEIKEGSEYLISMAEAELSGVVVVNGLTMNLPVLSDTSQYETSNDYYGGPFAKYVPATDTTDASGTVLTVMPGNGNSTFVTNSTQDVSVKLMRYDDNTKESTTCGAETYTVNTADSSVTGVEIKPTETGTYTLTISPNDPTVHQYIMYKFVIQ